MDVKMRKANDIQKKKKKRIQLGNIQDKRQTNDYTERRRNEKHNKTNLGGLRRLQLPNSFLLFLSRENPLLGMISTSDNPPDLISPLPTRITSTGTFVGEWIGLFVFFLDGNAQV